MKKFFSILGIAALMMACNPVEDSKPELPSAAGIVPVVTVDGASVTFALPAGVSGLIPIWETNESGDFVFAGSGNPYTKTFLEGGQFKVRMYVSNAAGQSKDYTEADFEVKIETTGFNGYDYNSEYNIWKKGEDAGMSNSYTYYNPDPNWGAETPLPINFGAGSYNITFEKGCYQQWQAQVHLVPTGAVALSAACNYDMSVLVTTNKAVGGVTFKLTDTTSDDNFLFVEQQDLVEGNNVFYVKNLPGIDAAATKLVLDFGYCTDGTEVTIYRITLKDHANDDGTNAPDKDPVIPEGPKEDEIADTNCNIDIAGSSNLWNTATIEMKNWYSASDWAGTLTADYKWVKEYSEYQVVIPEGIGGAEWQGQNQFATNIPVSAAKKYDFHCVVVSTEDTWFTVKLAKLGEDTAHQLCYYGKLFATKDTPREITIANLQADVDYEALTLFIDLGRTPAGASVTVKDFCFQEHK